MGPWKLFLQILYQLIQVNTVWPFPPNAIHHISFAGQIDFRIMGNIRKLVSLSTCGTGGQAVEFNFGKWGQYWIRLWQPFHEEGTYINDLHYPSQVFWPRISSSQHDFQVQFGWHQFMQKNFESAKWAISVSFLLLGWQCGGRQIWSGLCSQ